MLTVILFFCMFLAYYRILYCAVALYPLWNLEGVFVTISILFPFSLNIVALFHCQAIGYSCPDWHDFVIVPDILHGWI